MKDLYFRFDVITPFNDCFSYYCSFTYDWTNDNATLELDDWLENTAAIFREQTIEDYINSNPVQARSMDIEEFSERTIYEITQITWREYSREMNEV